MERNLAKVRETHQKAAALGEEIEWLTCPLIRSQSEVQACSKSRDCCVHRSRRQKRRCHQVQPEDCPATYFEHHPSQRNSESGGEVAATEEPNWRSHWNWGQRSPAFSEGWLRIPKRKMGRCLLPSPQWKRYGNG